MHGLDGVLRLWQLGGDYKVAQLDNLFLLQPVQHRPPACILMFLAQAT